MFKLISKLNLLEKAAILFIFIIVMMISYDWWKSHADVETLTVNNAIQAGVITQNTKVIEVAELLTEIKEEVNVKVRQEEIKVEKKHREINAKVVARETKINKDFLQQPATVDTAVLKYDQLSEVWIDSLWEAYCSDAPDPIACTIAVKDKEGAEHV